MDLMTILYIIATLVVGILIGLGVANMADKGWFPSGSIPYDVEDELRPPPPFAVRDGTDGDILLRTDDLQLAKDFRTEARDAGLPARLIINGKDRG